MPSNIGHPGCARFVCAGDPPASLCVGDSHLNALMHSHVFASQTLTVESLLALMTWPPSAEKMASLTYDVWPRNSLSILPDLRPCTRMVPSNDALSTWEGGEEGGDV